MNLNIRRQNFIKKGQLLFDYLTKEYGYTFKGIKQTDYTDNLIYENVSMDRIVILSNQYHPVDYGFEIQWYRPSISTNHSDREFQIYVLKENQDDNQQYLDIVAKRLRIEFEGIIKGEHWISSK